MKKEIRNIAISGVDTIGKYNKVIELTGGAEGIPEQFQDDIDCYFRAGDNIIFDNGDEEMWFHYWMIKENLKKCTMYKYEDFLLVFKGEVDHKLVREDEKHIDETFELNKKNFIERENFIVRVSQIQAVSYSSGNANIRIKNGAYIKAKMSKKEFSELKEEYKGKTS